MYLIDDFTGDPQELYNFVVEEISKSGLEGITYSQGNDLEFVRFFRTGDKAPSLSVDFRGKRFCVLGYQIGRFFHVSLRTTLEPEADIQHGYLYHITMSCFETVVRRSVKRAVTRHLQARNAPVPESLLKPEDVFFEPARQAS